MDKAVIATKGTSSWADDPSSELFAISSGFDASGGQSVTRLAEIVMILAPEHGRTTYGEPERFATPKRLYDIDAARRALVLAKEAFKLMKVLSRQGDTNETAHAF